MLQLDLLDISALVPAAIIETLNSKTIYKSSSSFPYEYYTMLRDTRRYRKSGYA